ncbi:unnamed protein product [Microthlaspi erraticum]|uniref:Uncharacterized protein n=1 Tax=Microthlaspi erraticum TaxID=1685480 RepID=A0A6D2JUA3_9BRAS|nr:unnamed protein product [Microthlaspi erraticum]
MLTLLNLLIDLFTLFFTWESSFSSCGMFTPISNSPASLSLLRGSFLLLVLLSFPHPLNLFYVLLGLCFEYPPCSSYHLHPCERCLLPSPLNILDWSLKCIKSSIELEL